ncbi:MAG TPA: hypothetical protein VK879_22820 [Candidatus Sulfomarinibacteraceae bacterium]|nr:hypothetical protein [Candidatus Sulfomarinibacteraceae bacterium]
MIDGKVPLLTVTSNSMRPLFQQGDQVGLCPTALQHLAPGDVVLLRDGNTFLTHRFCGLRQAESETTLLTRGDRPLTLDPPWSPNSYVGRVTTLHRSGRVLDLDQGVGRWLNQHLGRLARWEAHMFAPGSAGWLARWVRRAIFAYAMLVAALCRRLGQRREQSRDGHHESHISVGKDEQP